MSLFWGQPRCCQRKFEIHELARKLTEHLQGPRAALGAVGKEGIEKTKVAACRRQEPPPLGGKTHQPAWNELGRQNTLGGKPGGVQRQVVGGCHFVGCAGKASLGAGRHEEPVCCWMGDTLHAAQGYAARAGASRVREEAGRTSKGHVARPPASLETRGLDDNSSAHQASARAHSLAGVTRMTLWEVVSQSLLQQL